MLILGVLVLGLFSGWLAQLALGQGARPNGHTLLVGLYGSLVGGAVAGVLDGGGLRLRPAGLVGSFVGAVVVLLVWGALTRRRRPTG